MSISASISAFASTVTIEAFLSGRRLTPLAITTDHGFDTVSASATVLLSSTPSWIDFRQTLEIRAGWDGRTQTIFSGFVEAFDRQYFPFGCQIQAAGWLKLSQYQAGTAVVYTAQTDTQIVTDLLDDAGIPFWSIAGEGTTSLGVARSIELEVGAAPWEIINRLDQVFGYKTFDLPAGVVIRQEISGIPGGTAVWTYTQGSNIINISRPRTIRGAHNKVIVSGLAQPSITPSSTRQADNPYLRNPITDVQQYIAFDFRDDIIEGNTLAEAVSLRLMTEVNRVVEEVTVTIKGDPRVQPGQTVAVTSALLGLSAEKMWVKHVSHQAGDTYLTTLTLEGGQGEAGYETDLDPVALFTFLVRRETWLVAGTPTTYYTVACESQSYDADGTIAAYAWANNKNADVSTSSTYATLFTTAQLATATITLTVTDNDANTGALTLDINQPLSSITIRDLYVAASSRAEATSNGGSSWQTWTPGAGTVISTPTIAGETHSYFGLSTGALYRTSDYLATSPTLVHTFGAAVQCIWINEADANRVSVGLADGTVHRTLNADQLASSTWSQLVDLGASAVLDLVESAADPGQYRACVGSTVVITYDDFASTSTLITFDGTAYQIIPSLIGLPGKAAGADTTGNQPIQSEDGTAYTFPVLAPETDEARAGTHHIRQDAVWYADRSGRSFAVADAGTTFVQRGTLGSGDPANRMIRDGDLQEEAYCCCDDGLYKTYDSMASWKLLRDYAGGTLIGLQCGYGGLRAIGITATTIVSNTTDALTLNLWNGASNDSPPFGWRSIGYDDSSWAATVSAYIHPSYTPVSGTTAVAPTTYSQSLTQQALFRQIFALPSGVITTATLNLSTDDLTTGVWINNIWIASNGTAGGLITVSVDPAILFTGADNVIAVHATNVFGNGAPIGGFATSYKLEVS